MIQSINHNRANETVLTSLRQYELLGLLICPARIERATWALFLLIFDYFCYLGFKVWQINLDCFPNNLQIYLKITMC
jgi:hypothetical protein